ncbi:MAG: tryptophan synthase subunit alpha [bacterium]|nr:tryptophan synthase subunit alpha [bacterium]
MNRLGDVVEQLRRDGVRPVVPFVTAGFPDPDACRGALRGAKDAGCRLVEIGVPFSDPVADGPVIQAASQRALAQGMTLAGSLELAAWAHRELELAVVLMGYLNPVLRMGAPAFTRAAAAAGVAGVIVPDLPLEESALLGAALAEAGIDLVPLVAPTTDADRLRRQAERASGFLYLVSTTGVTGTGAGAGDDLEAYVARVRAACALPLYVGFGVGTTAQAARVASCADGAIVGSALLRRLETAGNAEIARATAAGFIGELDRAMNAGAAGRAKGERT